jgi:glutaredoxin
MTVLLFTSSHCPGCKPMKEKLRQFDVKGTVLNIDEDEEALNLARSLYVSSTPTLLIKNEQGEIIDTIIGDVGIDKLREVLS